MMSDAYKSHQRWLEERFSHVGTILDSIQRSVQELKQSHAHCSGRCNAEMGEVYHRLRDVEHRMAERNGAFAHEKEALQSRNVAWQMVIALGTALSAMGMVAGYLMGKV